MSPRGSVGVGTNSALIAIEKIKKQDDGDNMSAEDPIVYAICDVFKIEKGTAKPFSLARINEEGESRPFPIVIIRTHEDDVFGYANICPHKNLWLNINEGTFFSDDRNFLQCGGHGAKFEIESGLCVDGPCKDKSLEPLPVAVIDGEICLCGIELAEADMYPDPFADDYDDETMEIMIHPD